MTAQEQDLHSSGSAERPERRRRSQLAAVPVRIAAAAVLVVAFMLAGAGAASVALSRTVPLYQSDSALLFSPILSRTTSTAAFNAVNYISTRVNAYAVIGQSETFQDRVRAEVGSGVSRRLTFVVTGQADSLLLNVSATDVSTARASRAVQAFDELLVAEVERLDGTEARGAPLRVDIVAGPSANSIPVSPNSVTYYGVGVLAGLALALALLVGIRRIARLVATTPGTLGAAEPGRQHGETRHPAGRKSMPDRA